jgi:two-component system invasion response regulator UvrY
MIYIGIVDDHPVVRAGLKAALYPHTDLKIVGEANSGSGALELARNAHENERINVMLLDIDMPGQSGLDALRMLRARYEEIKVLIFSEFPEEHYAVNVLRHGASGYVHKSAEMGDLVNAIRVVEKRGRYTTPKVADILENLALHGKTDTLLHDLLSEREFQVFIKLAKGDALGEVSKDLSLSAKTVSTYRSRLLEKLNLTTNSDLTYYAMRHSLIS